MSEESYDEEKNLFFYSETFDLQLEHSLVSVSKWEETFEKPFLVPEAKTPEETLVYIRFMAVTPEVPSEVFDHLTKANSIEINAYIGAKMTATWFGESKHSSNTRVMTAEVLYYLMASYGIPIECERWHLNKLITLIRVFNEERAEKKKKSPADAARERTALNEKRLAEAANRQRLNERSSE